MTEFNHPPPEPAHILSIRQPFAWAVVAGIKTREHRTWKTSFRGRLFIHAAAETDWKAPAELWPPGGAPLLSQAVLGYVTVTGVEGEPGAWHWILTGPHALAVPLTGIRGHPGIWLMDLPPGVP